MHPIEKGLEPECLATLRRTPGASWKSVHGEQRKEIWEALCRDQRHLCAYCQSRLAETRIEHWEPRNASPEKVFHWVNLLGVCQGDEGASDCHCDNHRGKLPVEKQSLNHHPVLNPGIIRYTVAGEAWSEEATIQNDIQTLNLNHYRLKKNRHRILQKIRTEGKHLSAAKLRQMFNRWSSTYDGKALEFRDVALYHLHILLRSRENRDP